MQRTQSIASVTSLSIFKKKDKEWDNLYSDEITTANSTLQRQDELDEAEKHEIAFQSPATRRSRYALDPQSMIDSRSRSATNGLAALRINTPNTIRPSLDSTSRPSNAGPDPPAKDDHQPQSPVSPTYSSPTTPDSPLPPLPEESPIFLSLPTSDTSFDTFNLNIDFTKFENTKVELPLPKQPSPPKRINNHDFLFLVDDGPGIDHRAWETMADLVSGVTKRLVPSAATNLQLSNDLPSDAPSISLRFINNPRHIARVTNLTQIRNIFNWVTPRDAVNPKVHPRYVQQQQKQLGPHIPPLRILEYYFWNIYNTKLQKNTWVGQIPTTIVIFASSPLGNRPEDMDLFVAKCAEKLNHDQVPLPLISILVVQCNTDPILHRQLVDTKRMITWEWYTPKPKLPPPTMQNGRRGARQSMLTPPTPEPKKRPQRDWVDIITCVDWERSGGLNAIKGLVEEEIRTGTQRRRNLQKEVARNYLTTLGKDHSPPQQREEPSPISPVENSSDYALMNRCESPILPEEVYDNGRARNGYVDAKYKASQEFHHTRGALSLNVLPTTTRGIQYYD